jgi:hypothetical protein
MVKECGQCLNVYNGLETSGIWECHICGELNEIEPVECKYYSFCEYAYENSVTCVENGGGDYCGKFRILEGEK